MNGEVDGDTTAFEGPNGENGGGAVVPPVELRLLAPPAALLLPLLVGGIMPGGLKN